MQFKFCSLASGSKGNCYVVWKDKDIFLIDAGISGKKIEEGLNNLNLKITDVKGLFITHEHIDHTKSIKVLYKKNPNLKIYTKKETWSIVSQKIVKDSSLDDAVINIEDKILIGDIEVDTISLSHDAVNPVGYKMKHNNRSVAILTDTGTVDDEIFHKIKDTNLLVLESNHEENILHVCGYPYKTKMRILSDFGHLSNDLAARCIDRILEYRKENIAKEDFVILLAHLSSDNNSEHLARQTAQNVIDKRGWTPARFYLDVVKQNENSDVYII